jgi:ABC-type oligopeptide transport system ATPase subunit
MKMLSLLFFMMIGTSTLMAQTDVSDQEIEQFAVTFQKMRMINQQAQQELSEVITNEGMEINRFNTIHQAQMDPEKEVEMSKEEEKNYQAVIAKLNSMQAEFRQKIEEMVEEGGLSFERYEEIGNQLQNDAELQEKLREELTN